MKRRYLTHLELKQTGEHRYFGSIKNMIDIMKSEGVKLGVATQTLYNHHWFNPNNAEEAADSGYVKCIPYENSRCIIRRAPIEHLEKENDSSKKSSIE